MYSINLKKQKILPGETNKYFDMVTKSGNWREHEQTF
jgi:hypothetical protein